MAINLQKHKGELRKAWEDVHNPECDDNWVIFGYDGKTYELKVVEKGDGGLEEMVDSLSGGKIMYAAARVMDPNTDLPKLVFINWQGEGVPSSVKGTCASHWRDVTDFFKGAHVTIQARSEDDLDVDVVMDKVTKSSGANYSFHQEKAKPITNPSGQVGTNYKRVNPLAEINVKSRDKFWMEQEKAEQQRIEDEKKRLANARQADEVQRKKREAKEQAERDRLVRERAESIESQKIAAKKELERRKEEEKKRYEETIREANKDDEEFRTRSESLRKQRLKEAQELIRERKKSFGEVSPREAFEPSSKKVPPPVQPRMRSRSRQRSGTVEETEITEEQAKPSAPVTQPKPIRPSQPVVPQPAPEPAREPSPKPVRKPQPARQPSPEPHPEPLRQPSPEPEPVFEPQEPPEQQHPQDVYEEITFNSSNKITTQEAYTDIPDHHVPRKEAEPTAGNTQTAAEETHGASGGLTAQAIYDYQAVDDTEITFDPGDIITDVEQIDEGWWKGKAPDGRFGMFPANYVTVVTDAVQEPAQEPVASVPADEIYEQIEVSKQPVASEPVADAEVGLSARAIYDYQAADDSEISFDPGDIITQIKQIDKDWWTGATSRGQYGMFPANFVELISEDHQAVTDHVTSAVDTGLCAKAVFDYQAADETEISFDPGDIITNVEQVDPGWWKGTVSSGANGLFPANYVELIS